MSISVSNSLKQLFSQEEQLELFPGERIRPTRGEKWVFYAEDGTPLRSYTINAVEPGDYIICTTHEGSIVRVPWVMFTHEVNSGRLKKEAQEQLELPFPKVPEEYRHLFTNEQWRGEEEILVTEEHAAFLQPKEGTFNLVAGMGRDDPPEEVVANAKYLELIMSLGPEKIVPDHEMANWFWACYFPIERFEEIRNKLRAQ